MKTMSMRRHRPQQILIIITLWTIHNVLRKTKNENDELKCRQRAKKNIYAMFHIFHLADGEIKLQ